MGGRFSIQDFSCDGQRENVEQIDSVGPDVGSEAIDELLRANDGFVLAIRVTKRDRYGQPIAGELVAKAETVSQLSERLTGLTGSLYFCSTRPK